MWFLYGTRRRQVSGVKTRMEWSDGFVSDARHDSHGIWPHGSQAMAVQRCPGGTQQGAVRQQSRWNQGAHGHRLSCRCCSASGRGGWCV